MSRRRVKLDMGPGQHYNAIDIVFSLLQTILLRPKVRAVCTESALHDADCRGTVFDSAVLPSRL